MKIDRVEIERLRGVRHGVVDGLSPLSILVGPNNCGKSTVLEALVLSWMSWAAPSNVPKFVRRRGGPIKDALKTFVHGSSQPLTTSVTIASASGSVKSSISRPAVLSKDGIAQITTQGLRGNLFEFEVEAKFHDGSISRYRLYCDSSGKQARGQKLSIGEPRAVSLSFVDVNTVRGPAELEAEYSRLEKWGRLDDAIAALRVSMPDLKDLRILQVDDDFILHITHKNQPPTPAYLAGDGFKRFLALAAALFDGEDEVLALEEPESYLHPRYVRELVALLHAQVRKGKQVILCTHSHELIDQLLTDEEGQPPIDATVHRLRLHEGELRSVAVSASDARLLRAELFEDLRT
ncbi:MAG: AAA family ATPase [Myxococcales bacterium]|nr:AAA family ATPase [Myxococcales bacterium]